VDERGCWCGVVVVLIGECDAIHVPRNLRARIQDWKPCSIGAWLAGWVQTRVLIRVLSAGCESAVAVFVTCRCDWTEGVDSRCASAQTLLPGSWGVIREFLWLLLACVNGYLGDFLSGVCWCCALSRRVGRGGWGGLTSCLAGSRPLSCEVLACKKTRLDALSSLWWGAWPGGRGVVLRGMLR